MAYMRHIINLPDIPSGKKPQSFPEPKRCIVCQATSRRRFCGDCAPLVDMAKWSESALAILRKRFKHEIPNPHRV